MTNDETQLKSDLGHLRKAVRDLESRIDRLVGSCKHRVGVFRKDRTTTCVVCNANFGWACPKSPDGVCHYLSCGPGLVQLIDGTSVPTPQDHDIEYETPDDCMFCHEPEERK